MLKEFKNLFEKGKLLWKQLLIVIVVRVSISLGMFKSPFIFWLLSISLDYLDAIYLDQIYKMGREPYELLDKYIDMVVNLVMLSVGIKYDIFITPLLFFLAYRLLGQYFYWKTKKEYFLILFPNFFEAYWLWSVAIPTLILLKDWQVLYSFKGLILLLLIKLLNEIYTHYLYPKYIYEISTNKVWKPIHKILKF